MTDEAKYLAAGVALVGFLVRLLKGDGVQVALANLGLPPIPKRTLPWFSLVFGLAYAVLVERQLGKPWLDAFTVALVAGTAVGGGAAYVHDLGKGVPGVNKVLAVSALLVMSLASSACTPQQQQLLFESLASKIQCAIANQDLPNEQLILKCAIDPADIRRVLEIVAESREATAKAVAAEKQKAGACGPDGGAP